MDSRVTTTPYLEAQRAQLGLVWRLLTGPPELAAAGGQLERPAGAASLPVGELHERLSVGRRRGVLVIVEIGEHVGFGREGVRNPAEPGAQRLRAVARPWVRPSLVEPYISPGRRPPQRAERPAAPV